MSTAPIFRSTSPTRHCAHEQSPFIMKTCDPFHDFFKDHHHHTMLSPHIPFHNKIITPLFETKKRVELNEVPEAYTVRAEVPGLRKEEIKVTVEDGRVLKIRGEKHLEREERHENWQHYERGKEKFFSALTLPENSKIDQMRSSLDNGVLVVNVPKKDAAAVKSHVKDVEIKG